MRTLRSYNSKMRKFAQPTVKRSRRKFAIGGETSNWDPTYGGGAADPIGGSSLQNMETLRGNYAKGGRAGYAEGDEVNELYTEEELAQLNAPDLTAGAATMPPRQLGDTFVERTPPATPPAPLTSDLPEADYKRPPTKSRTGHPMRQVLLRQRALYDANALGVPGMTLDRAPTVPMQPEEMIKSPNVQAAMEDKRMNNPENFGTLGMTITDEGKPAAPGYTTDEEQAAGLRNVMLKHYGLGAGTTRESTLPGGITKYKDASGKTLYANTTDLGGETGRVNVYKSGPVAKANADRLTSMITSRLASGAPEDLEQARQLAVTPEHRALIADADNMRGLRNRVALGDPTAVLELQSRTERGKLQAQSQAAMMTELFKHQLGQQLTPYQQADLGLRASAQAQTQARETRAENFAQNNAMISNYFGSDEVGKAAATRFHQRLAQTLPDLKGDLSQLKPEQQNLLLGASKVLDLYEASEKPGWLRRAFGAKPPQFNQLLEAFKDAKFEENTFFGSSLVTPLGRLDKSSVDPGTWRDIVKMVDSAKANKPAAQPTLKAAATR